MFVRRSCALALLSSRPNQNILVLSLSFRCAWGKNAFVRGVVNRIRGSLEALSLIPFALALTVTAGTPGPSIAALVARVVARGWRDVLPFLVALWVGEVVWLTCAVLGLSALAEKFHTVFVLLKYAGVAYLAYLAWRMWRAPVEIGTQSLAPRQSARGMFAAGIAITLGNPKIMVFYIALLPSLIDLTEVSLAQWFVLSAVAVLSIAATDGVWVLLAERARKMLRTPGAVQVVNRISAVTLGGAAGLIATR